MKKLQIGLIGCGGRQEGHINSLLQMENVQIAVVADPIEARRLAAANKTGATRIYRDHTELYAKETADTLDALFIAIEPTAHNNVEERAIELGIPFLVEKPMTLDPQQAEKIAAQIAEKGLITAVGFQDRYLDLMEIVKEEVPKHRGGLVYGAWVGGIPGVWWWQKKSTCGGQLLEQNIHLLDGLRWLYGEPLSVYATASTGIVKAGVDAKPEYDTDDHSTCVVRFANNITATLVSGCYIKSSRPNSGLVITMDDMILDYRLRNNLIISTANETRDIRRQNDQTHALDRAFLKGVETKSHDGIRSPYADALKTLKLAFAANKSMENGEVIYFS